MNILNKFKLTLTGVCLVMSAASFASARQPILCDFDASVPNPDPIVGTSIKDIIDAQTRLSFQGFVDVEKGTVNYFFYEETRKSKIALREKADKNFLIEDGYIVIDISANGENFPLRVSKEIFSTSAPVKGFLKNRVLECSQFISTFYSPNFSVSLFDNLNLPDVVYNDQINTKDWTSSDGKFKFEAKKYKTSTGTKHYPGVFPAHTVVRVDMNGLVIDNNEDLAGAIGYMFGRNSDKVIQTRLTNKADVEMMTKIFNTKTTLDLKPFNDSMESVKVTIDCSSGSECTVTASRH